MLGRSFGRAWPTRAWRPVGTRIAWGIVTWIAASILIFGSTVVLPGNVVTSILGPVATPESVAYLTDKLKLDRPVTVQYWDWFGSFVTGDFGTSLANQQAVTDVVGGRVVNSAILVFFSAILSILVGGGLGLLEVVSGRRFWSNVRQVGSVCIASLPLFTVGIFLLVIFATRVWRVLPAVSTVNPGESVLGRPEALVLPVLAIVIVSSPYIYRMTRASGLDVLRTDYCEVASLKGVGTSRLLLRHVLPNALPSMIQATGYAISFMAGGVVVVERLFNYPGVGSELVQALEVRDVPVIQFVALTLAGFYIVVNMLADALAILVTPKGRLQS